MGKHANAPPGKKWIFRPFITTKDGKMIWASTYGLRAFRILVDEDGDD